MTVTEFWEKVDSIDVDSRDDGRYTDDEMYDIGCTFIKLNNAQKREIGGWDKLVEILKPLDKDGNVMVKGDTFRQWVKGRRYDKGEMVRNEHVLSEKTIDELSFDEFEAKVDDIKAELYKQQVKTRDAANSYRRTLRDEARIESLHDLIKESTEGLKSLPEIMIPEADVGGDVEAVMLLSDLHIGMNIDNFYNTYNSDIARKRLQKYVSDVISICRSRSVVRLNILNLGDMIDGNLRVTARIEDTEDLVSQIMKASEFLAEALNRLQEAAPEVIYRSCSDNHSRVTPNFKDNIEKENYFRLIDFYLKARLKDTGIVFAEDNLDVDLGFFELLNGKKVVFAHGHRDNVNTAIQNALGATRQYVDYVCVGHYHESKMKSFQGAKVFVNSSICGSDGYAQSKRLYGNAEQTLLVFEGGNLSVNYINLDIKK